MLTFDQDNAHSQMFINFYEHYKDSYESIIEFYEVNQRGINGLALEEQIVLLNEYLNATFETGRYHKYIAKADDLIENSIFYNVTHLNGQEVYKNTLFRKAASYFHESNFDKALHICMELRRMDRANLNYRMLERKCKFQKYPKFIRFLGGKIAFIMMLGMSLLLLEVFLIKTYLPWSLEQVDSQVFIFVPAILVFWLVNHFMLKHILSKIDMDNWTN